MSRFGELDRVIHDAAHTWPLIEVVELDAAAEEVIQQRVEAIRVMHAQLRTSCTRDFAQATQYMCAIDDEQTRSTLIHIYWTVSDFIRHHLSRSVASDASLSL